MKKWLPLLLFSLVALTASATPPAEDRELAHDGLSSYAVPRLGLDDSERTDSWSIDVEVRPDGSIATARSLPRDWLIETTASRWTFVPFKGTQTRWRTVTIHLDADEDSSEEPAVQSRYESPLTLSVWRRLRVVLRFPRVDGRVPEKLCEVHGERMTVELVRFAGGGLPPMAGQVVPLPVMEYHEARKLFPNMAEFVVGGCFVGAVKQVEIYVCASCRKARQAWFRDHPDFIAPD